MSDNALWIILQRLRTPLLVIIVTYAIAILGMVLIPGLDDKGEVYHLSFFDAFYFISYTASTIGFGETPYDFTYEQRLWVLICIYLTVIGWFYGLGALVSVVSDKTLKFELMRSRFRKQVEKIKVDFIIVLGYTHVNVEITKQLLESGLKVVFIDESEENINHLMLEDFSQSVAVMVGNVLLIDTLKDAGIRKKNCKAIIALFDEEDKNLRVSILSKFLNPHVKVIAKSTLYETTTSLLDTDIAKVQNPFEIFAKRLDIALTSPHVLILENWIYQNSDLTDIALFLPRGRYIICGYGRFGKALQEKLEKHGIDYVFIDERHLGKREMIENETFLRANADDKAILCEAGIKEASCLIAGTQNDIDNISILITAKKLNPDIYLIARENTMEEISIFQAAKINWVFMIESILINKTALFLADALKHRFLKLVLYKDEIWATSLVNLLKSQINKNPTLITLKVCEDEAYALFHDLALGEDIKIEILLKSLSNWEKKSGAIPLLIKREAEEILLPSNESLYIGDHILFACDNSSKEEIELIASNCYELHYARFGKEKESQILKKILLAFRL